MDREGDSYVSRTPGFSYFDTPRFPLTIYVEGQAVVTLHADGTWSGDLGAIEHAVGKMPMADALVGALLWLIMREMRRG